MELPMQRFYNWPDSSWNNRSYRCEKQSCSFLSRLRFHHQKHHPSHTCFACFNQAISFTTQTSPRNRFVITFSIPHLTHFIRNSRISFLVRPSSRNKRFALAWVPRCMVWLACLSRTITPGEFQWPIMEHPNQFPLQATSIANRVCNYCPSSFLENQGNRQSRTHLPINRFGYGLGFIIWPGFRVSNLRFHSPLFRLGLAWKKDLEQGRAFVVHLTRFDSRLGLAELHFPAKKPFACSSLCASSRNTLLRHLAHTSNQLQVSSPTKRTWFSWIIHALSFWSGKVTLVPISFERPLPCSIAECF